MDTPTAKPQKGFIIFLSIFAGIALFLTVISLSMFCSLVFFPPETTAAASSSSGTASGQIATGVGRAIAIGFGVVIAFFFSVSSSAFSIPGLIVAAARIHTAQGKARTALIVFTVAFSVLLLAANSIWLFCL